MIKVFVNFPVYQEKTGDCEGDTGQAYQEEDVLYHQVHFSIETGPPNAIL